MGINIWSFLAGVASAFFVWILKELSQWKQHRKDDRRIRNTVLFNLLELLYLLKRLDTSEMAPLIINVIEKKFPGSNEFPEVKTQLIKFLGASTLSFLIKKSEKEITELSHSLDPSLIEYAKVNPLQAHRLRGKAAFIEKLQLLKDYTYTMGSEFEADKEEIEKTSQNMQEIITPTIIKKLIENLKEEILEISSKIGYSTKRKIKKIINQDIEIEADQLGMFDTLLENFNFSVNDNNLD